MQKLHELATSLAQLESLGICLCAYPLQLSKGTSLAPGRSLAPPAPFRDPVPEPRDAQASVEQQQAAFHVDRAKVFPSSHPETWRSHLGHQKTTSKVGTQHGDVTAAQQGCISPSTLLRPGAAQGAPAQLSVSDCSCA